MRQIFLFDIYINNPIQNLISSSDLIWQHYWAWSRKTTLSRCWGTGPCVTEKPSLGSVWDLIHGVAKRVKSEYKFGEDFLVIKNSKRRLGD
jgi:hypothetical protein